MFCKLDKKVHLYLSVGCVFFFFFFQAEDGIRDYKVTGVQTCALPISQLRAAAAAPASRTKPKRRVAFMNWSSSFPTGAPGEWREMPPPSRPRPLPELGLRLR